MENTVLFLLGYEENLQKLQTILGCVTDSCIIRWFSNVTLLMDALRGACPDAVIVFPDWHPESLKADIGVLSVDFPTVPVVVVAGAATRQEAAAFLAAGAADFVSDADPRGLDGALYALRRKFEAVEAVRRREAFQRAVFEALPVGLLIVNEAGDITSFNSAGKKIWGGKTDGELQRPCEHRAWWHDTGKRIKAEEWGGWRALHGGEVSVGEIVDIECSDGTRKTVVHSSVPIRDEKGSIIATALVAEDLTEAKRLEQQVMQAYKMESVGLLAGGIAHDFNNLLTAINGYGQLIEENLPPGDELLKMSVEQVLAAGRRASELTQKLLAFSRKQPLTLAAVKIDEVIANAATFLTRLIGEDITLTTLPRAHDGKVMVDNAQLDQVLINLVINARDALATTGGKIVMETKEMHLSEPEARQLSLEKGGDYATISVSDNGPGMDEKTKKKIFEPFFTTKETGKGTGLGLSIAYGIIRQHHGAITVESSPGKGTIFTIFLPLVRSRLKKTSLPQRVIPFGGAEKILLAEDDEIVRDYLSTVLAQSGYAVVTARDGLEAGDRFREHANDISLVITDVVMPRKNGREIHEDIKKLKPETKIIYISGYTADIINKKGVVDRNIDFLMKPVSRGDLLQKVREVLDRQ